MKVAIFASNMNFFQEIYEEICRVHDVRLFEEPVVKIPIGRSRFHNILRKRRIKSLMAWADVSFFEWADHYLVEATQYEKRSKIITRLHRYELSTFAEAIDWSKVDSLILISSGMKSKVLKEYPQLEKKIVLIPNVVDIDKFKKVDRAKNKNVVLGTLGNIIPRKRIYDLILAFSKLNDDKYLLRIGGKCTDNEYCLIVNNLVQNLNLEGKVIFDGYVENLPEWYSGIDIFINNAYDEGYAVTIQEAIASGCYPLVHHWVGAAEYVPEENLFRTSKQLVEKIREYDSKKDSFNHKSANEKLERCRKDKVVSAIFSLME